MKPYTRMTKQERDRIAVLRSRGLTWRLIAHRLGRSHSSLLREWRRNGRGRLYLSHRAQEQAVHRLRESHRRKRLKTYALREDVETLLRQGWSPEIIAGRLARQMGRPVISHEAIYQWIYAEARYLIGCLVRSHPKRWPRYYSPHAKRGRRIPERVPIAQRPLEAQTRQQSGHWETDLLVDRGSGALQVTVERQTRYTRVQKLSRKTAAVSSAALFQIFSSVPKPLRRSVTYDNGPENVEHLRLAPLGLRSYFCEPYHSWEKGTVENTNGLLRRFLPKKTDLATISPERIREIESWLNNRPRKCLGFQTPAEAFSALGAIAA